MKDQLLQPESTATAKTFISAVAATLGIGTFMGVVNTLIGLASLGWLIMQMYGYFRYDLPLKRMNKQMAKRALDKARTVPAPLAELGADE